MAKFALESKWSVMKKSLLYKIKYFSPAWYGMVMSTGISASILASFSYPTHWLRKVALTYWACAITWFVLFSAISGLRYLLYRQTSQRILQNPTQSLYWACIPMALSSIIASTNAIFGKGAVWACYALWWITFALSLLLAWGMVFYTYVKHSHTEIETLNAVIILPVVTPVVHSTTAASLVRHLPLSWQAHMIVMSMLLLGNGFLLAYLYMAVYVWRLLTRNMPSRENSISCFLPIGPCCQCAFGLLLTSQNVESYFDRKGLYPTLKEFPVLSYVAIAAALFLVGFGTFWLFIACVACLYYRPRRFGIGWWGLGFPIGTYAVATYELGRMLDSTAFKVVSCIVGTIVAVLSLCLTFVTFYFALINEQVFIIIEEIIDSDIEACLDNSEKTE
ncbi:voltage-dependent anion channel [Lipomyces arxii]|uniref:voltage-dependent anion channel n=1 Tax=Lipomyces arxii TaxID=56418 RepID=UPI0034CE50C2